MKLKAVLRYWGFAVLAGTLSLGSFAETMYDWTTSGSYKIGATKSVTLNSDGDLYLTLSGFKAGKEYTITVSGSSASAEVLYTYKDDGDVWDDTLASSEATKTDNQEICYVYYDDWTSAFIVLEDDDDAEFQVKPKGYFLHVSGEAGASITITSVAGIVEEKTPQGDPENPVSITPATVPNSYSDSYVDGAFYFTASVAAGRTYLFYTRGGTESIPVNLSIKGNSSVYSIEDVTDTVSATGNHAYLVSATANGVLTIATSGRGASFGLTYQYGTDATLCRLTVATKGAQGTWSIKGASGTYAADASVVFLGSQTVVFGKVTGYSTPDNQTVTPKADTLDQEIVGTYNDEFDPKDDAVSGATKLTISVKEAKAGRTLFANDAYDHFAFSAQAGVYYNFRLDNLEGDALMTIFPKGKESAALEYDTKILSYAPGKGDFIIRVKHMNAIADDSSYTLAYSSASVGTIQFAKTAVTAKKSSGSVTLSVTRSSSDGKVRVEYGTVNGTAQPGVDYYAQTGTLTWESGDKAAKSITIKLIPELCADKAISRSFKVALRAMDPEALADDEYPATLAANASTCTVTVTEAKGNTEKEVEPATVKTEDVPLETGTYTGVLKRNGSVLSDGYRELGSFTFTAKNTTAKALSAKVMIGGKTYAFSADTWTEKFDGYATATMKLKTTLNKQTYENVLEVMVIRGQTKQEGDWLGANMSVYLTMNLLSADSSEVVENVVYEGDAYRDNSKIQDYLTAVAKVAGYYTITLVPSGVTQSDGIPAGNGYLTMTVNNKGKATIGGLLADGSTKPTYSSLVTLQDYGKEVIVPIYSSKSPYCFGGTLRLVKGSDDKYVVASDSELVWNNDNALLTYEAQEGWNIKIDPFGGYFNTVNNLQAYYLTHLFSVSTTDTEDFPTELLTSGYQFVTSNQPSGTDVTVAGNAIATEKRVLVKKGTSYDLDASVNPCNVQVKLVRATGLVTGTFSVWSEKGTVLKEITGFKHYGVLLLSRDENAELDASIMTAGFFTKAMTRSYETAAGKKASGSWTMSHPFNILAEDQGEPDWYAEDWGEPPANGK